MAKSFYKKSFRLLATLSAINLACLSVHCFAANTSESTKKCDVHLEVKKDAFVHALQGDPIGVYENLRERAIAARAAGQSSFEFHEMRPNLEIILEKISGYLSSSEKAHQDSREKYESLDAEGKRILDSGILYHDFIRWSMRFIEQVDRDYRVIHPHFTSYYHQNLAKNVVEDLLEKWPDVIAFPSFQAVGFDYFFDTRVVPVHVIGFTTEAIFGDGFDLTPAEFAYHDWGHIEFLSLRDIDHLTDPHTKLSATLREWLENRNDILSALKALKKSDPDLFRGVQMTLFEVLHERGYPYDLYRLKAQFETTKWTEILHRKLTNNFWKNLVFTPKQLERLTEARQWLLNLTQKLIEKRNLKTIQELRASEKPVRVRYSPPVETLAGTFIGAHFTEEAKIVVDFKADDGQLKSCGIYDVSLAQISHEEAPDFKQEDIQLLEKLLWVQWKGARIELSQDINHQQYRLINISLDTSGKIILNLKDEEGTLKKVGLNEINIPFEVSTNEFVIKDVEIYKLRQMLALHSRGQKTTFIVQDPQEYFEGIVRKIKNPQNSETIVEIEKTDSHKSTITRPISDLWFNEDGPILFTVKSNEVAAEKRARELNVLFSHARATKFSTSNILWRLERDVRFRDTSVLIPNEMNTDSFMEALIAVRTLKTNGAARVYVSTNKFSSFLKISDVDFDFDPLELFRIAGATSLRVKDNKLKKINRPKFTHREAVFQRSYLMSIRGDQLHNAVSESTQIPIWNNFSMLPHNSQVYLFMDGGIKVNKQFIECLALIHKLKEKNNRVTVVTPYLPFARSDKVDEAGGVTVTGRLGSDLLESVGMDSVIFMRAHAPQSQGFFSVPSEHLSSRPTLVPFLKKLGVEKIIAPDEGAQKAASLFAKDLKIGISTANKQRDPLDQSLKILGLSDMQVQGLTLAIVDDELETGGTSSKVVDLLKVLGAKKVYVIVTHLTGDAQNLIDNPNVDGIICTDTVNNPAMLNKKFKTVSIATELSERILILEKAQRMSR